MVNMFTGHAIDRYYTILHRTYIYSFARNQIIQSQTTTTATINTTTKRRKYHIVNMSFCIQNRQGNTYGI